MFLNICEKSSVLSMVYLIKYLVNILTIIIPVALIFMLSIDILKVVIDVKTKEGLKKIFKRTAIAVVVFFIPQIVDLVLVSLLGQTAIKDNSCYLNATTENIRFFSDLEDARKQEKINEEEQERLRTVKKEQAEKQLRENIGKKNKEIADKEKEIEDKEKEIEREKKNQEKKNTSVTTVPTTGSTTVNPGAQINEDRVCIYHQGDYGHVAFGNGKVPGATIQSHGCGPTSCAVVACTLYQDTRYNPVDIARTICTYPNACQTGGTTVAGVVQYLQSIGLKVRTQYNFSKSDPRIRNDIINSLNNGSMLIVNVVGHYYVVYGIDANENVKRVEVGDRYKTGGGYPLSSLISNLVGYMVISR